MAVAGGLSLEPRKLFRYPDPKLDTAIWLPKTFKDAEEAILLSKASIYWVVGARGSGKSQLLHYVARRYLSKLPSWKILPVFVEMQGSYGEGVYEANRFRENFSQFLLRSLFSLSRDIEVDYPVGPLTVQSGGAESIVADSLRTYLRDYLAIGERLIDDWARGQPEGWASRKAEAVLTEMVKRKVVEGCVLIIDDFDKYRYETISDCLLKQQAFYSHLVDLGCRMFFTASDQWFRYVADTGNTEWNFYQGVAARNYFEVPRIGSIEDARALIESRLLATSDGLAASPPFLPGAYLALVQESKGVPRRMIDFAQAILDSVDSSEAKVGREKAAQICRLQEKPPELRYVETVAKLAPNPYTKLTVHQVLWRLAKNERLAALFRIFYRKPEITYDVHLVAKYLGTEFTESEYEREIRTLTEIGAVRQRRVSEELSGVVNDLLDDLMMDLDDLLRLVAGLPEVLLVTEAGSVPTSRRSSPVPVTRQESWSPLQTWTYVVWSDEEMQPYLQATTAQLGLEFDYDVLQRYLGREYDVRSYLQKVGTLARMGLVDARGPVNECRETVSRLRDGSGLPRLDSRDVAEGIVRMRGVASVSDVVGALWRLAEMRVVPASGPDSVRRVLDSLADEGRLIRADWGEDYFLGPNALLDSKDLLALGIPSVASEVSSWVFVINLRLEASRLLSLTQDLSKIWLTRLVEELIRVSGIQLESKTFEQVDPLVNRVLSPDSLRRWEFTRQLLSPEPVIKDPRALMSSTVETLGSIGTEIVGRVRQTRMLDAFERQFLHQRLKEDDMGEISRLTDFLLESKGNHELVPALLAAQSANPIRFHEASEAFTEHLVKRYAMRGAYWSHECGLEVWLGNDVASPEMHHPGCDISTPLAKGAESYWVRDRGSLELWRKAIALAVLKQAKLPAGVKSLSFVQRARRSYDIVVLSQEACIGLELMRRSGERAIFAPEVAVTRLDPSGTDAAESTSVLTCEANMKSLLDTVKRTLNTRAESPAHA